MIGQNAEHMKYIYIYKKNGEIAIVFINELISYVKCVSILLPLSSIQAPDTTTENKKKEEKPSTEPTVNSNNTNSSSCSLFNIVLGIRKLSTPSNFDWNDYFANNKQFELIASEIQKT